MHTQNKVGSKKISKKLIYQVCSYIRVGTPIETAAIAAGIDKSDYHLWMREGKSSHHYDHCENCDFAMFYRQITIARAQTVATFFAFIMKAAANGEWQASVWWLEKYGNLDEQENSQTTGPVTFEELESLMERVSQMRNSRNLN